MQKKTYTFIIWPYTLSAFLIISVLTIAYMINFDSSFSSDNSDWGDFGSYIGGFGGALLSFITIILLLKTLHIQNKNSRDGQFESSFFELFKMNKEIALHIKGIEDPSMDSKQPIYQGYEYFYLLSQKIEYSYSGEVIGTHSKEEIQQHVNNFYKGFYKGREAELGHYFRSLYHLLKYVNDAGIEDKKKYVDLIQAQLSDSELHITFYNAISDFGKEKLLPLLEDYSFLENIKPKEGAFDFHFKLFYPRTYANYEKKPHIIK